MKKFLLLAAVLLSTLMFAEQKSMFTTAASGLVLRSQPTVKSSKRGLIPYGTKVSVLDKSEKEETIAEKTSSWFKVSYNGKTGWVFGGFLSDKPEAEYLIRAKSAGNISIGDKISKIKESGYTFRESSEDAGEGYTRTVYQVFDKKEKLLKVYTSDTSSGMNSKIDEIIIISKRYKTSDGIGVGSQLTEFLETYKGNSLWYTYVSDMFVAETEQYKGIQFLVNGYIKSRKKLGSSDMVTLSPSDFSVKSRITSIRIY